MFNFAAGPAAIPEPVLARAREEMLTRTVGMPSLVERPFTGPAFRRIVEQAQERLRALLDVPDNYRILFLAGGAMAQFGLLPLNLMGGKSRAVYVDSGYWAGRAIAEARRYAMIDLAATAWRDTAGLHLPSPCTWAIPADAAYCHFTANETADGAEFPELPETPFAAPLVCDMTSSFLSRPLEVSRYGLVYAGGQKNIGPAGLTVVLVRADLLGHAAPHTPEVFNYTVQAQDGSCHNTPPTFALGLANLVFAWIAENGGLPAMARANAEKSVALYAAIDSSDGFYHCPVAPDSRSRMNVCFLLNPPTLDDDFVAAAEAAGLFHLRGHPRIGGMRASLYNAVPMAGVAALVDFMADFRRRHG